MCLGYILLPERYTWVPRACLIWGPVPQRSEGPGRRGRRGGVGVALFKAPETPEVGKSSDLRVLTPPGTYCLLSECPVPPAHSNSVPGSLAQPERELWRRPGTCRATFVLGADCGGRRGAPSGPGRKGARACARPWKPRFLPVPASSRREQSLGRAGR